MVFWKMGSSQMLVSIQKWCSCGGLHLCPAALFVPLGLKIDDSDLLAAVTGFIIDYLLSSVSLGN